jgi:AcrR family transcriptional regulator
MPRTSRAARKSQTREQLVAAALRCFEAQGFAATTLERIAEEAGVTTGAVYSNFRNKEALFLELIGRLDPQPVDLTMLSDATRALPARFRSFGEVNARQVDLPPTTMATWYEVRSFALRSTQARAAAHDVVQESLETWGERIDRLSPSVGARPVVPGKVVALITQAMLDGLRGMRAFLPDEVTAEVYGEATHLLAHLFEQVEQTSQPGPPPRLNPGTPPEVGSAS